MVPVESVAERERLLLMARKLYKFVTPIGALAVIYGTVAVVRLRLRAAAGCMPRPRWWSASSPTTSGAAGCCKTFAAGQNSARHVWFRFFNEVPVLALLAVCILVVVKPF